MITGAYAREMARYNTWQNNQLAEFFEGLTQEELTRERGAFFGSILGTANHLLWGDWIWMSRFDKGEGPNCGIPESTAICADLSEWLPLRNTMDLRRSERMASPSEYHGRAHSRLGQEPGRWLFNG